MAVSISSVFAPSRADMPLIDKVDEAVTAKVLNLEYMQDARFGTPDKPYWQITVGGHLSDAEKHILAKRWVDAGWHNVSVMNSSDNGCGAGLVCVTLHKFP